MKLRDKIATRLMYLVDADLPAAEQWRQCEAHADMVIEDIKPIGTIENCACCSCSKKRVCKTRKIIKEVGIQ